VGDRALTFTDPTLFLIGVVLTALVLVGLWSHGVRRRKLARFLGGSRALDRVSRRDLSRFGLRRTILLGLAGLSLAAAAAGPHWEDAPEQPAAPVKRAILAIDVSASMQAADEPPTRLAEAVEVARGLIDDLEGQEVGLVLYAGRAYPLAPPTYDLHAIRFLLDGVAPTVASSYDPGTLMSTAIDESLALFARNVDTAAVTMPASPPPQDMILFVSDGDAPEPDEGLADAFERAREAGVQIHAVGIGTSRGTGMAMPRGTYQMGGPILDANGQPGVTRLNEGVLERLASEGSGLYANASTGDGLDALHADLLEPTVAPEVQPADLPPPWARHDLAYVLGLFALALVFLESLIDVTLPRLTFVRAREAT
jgi:Ca-activated chloride channel family protein